MPPLRVLHITDTHVKGRPPEEVPQCLADGLAQMRGETTRQSLRRLLEAARGWGPVDLLLHTGDVVDDGRDDSYAHAFEEFEAFGVPLEVIAGNHDDPTMLGRWAGHAPAPVRVRDVGAWRLVLLNSSSPGSQVGTLPPDSLADLDAALAIDRPVLVALHHPPVGGCDDPECRLANHTSLLDVFDRHDNVKLVATGHLHLAREVERNGVTYLLGPSTCLQLKHVHPLVPNNRATTPLGARMVTLHEDGSFQNELRWMD